MPKGLIDVIEDLLHESHNGEVKDSGDANTGDHRSGKVEADKGPHSQSGDNGGDVGKAPSKGKASSKVEGDKGPHNQSSDHGNDEGGKKGHNASGASSKIDADKGPHNQASDCFEEKEDDDMEDEKDDEQDDDIKDIKSKFNKLIDAEKHEDEPGHKELKKVKEQHDIHIHIGDQGKEAKRPAPKAKDAEPSKAPKAPEGGRGDEGGDESGDGGADEIPADRGDSAEKDRNPSLGETTDKKSFAALAEPKDKVTFADKLAGIKKKKMDEDASAGKKPAWPWKPGSYKTSEPKTRHTQTGVAQRTATGVKHTRTKYEEAFEMHQAVVAEMVNIIGEEYLHDYLAEGRVDEYVHEDDMGRFIELQELALELEEAMKKMKDEDVHLHLDGGDKEGGEEKGDKEEGGDKEGGDDEVKGGKIPPTEPSKDVEAGKSEPDEGGEDEGGEDEGGEKKNPFAEGKTFRRNAENDRKQAQQKERQQQQAQKRARRMAEGAEEGDMEETKVGKSPDQGPIDQSTCHAGDEGKSPSKGKASSKAEGDKGPHNQSSDHGGDEGGKKGDNASGASSKVDADKGPVNQSGENKSFKEDIDLNEEFKEKAKVIFETAVNEKVAVITEEMEAAYQAALAEEVNAIQDVIAEAVAEAISEWLATNQLEIKYSLRTEIAENFIRGMRDLVAENYIEIPPEEVSIVDELSEAVEDFKTRDNESQKLIEELQSEILAMRRDSIIAQVAEDLTETQKLKLVKLSESVEATSIEEFESKLGTLKETYFAEGFDNSALLSSLSEGVIGVGDNFVDDDDTSVGLYAQFLSKTSKK